MVGCLVARAKETHLSNWEQHGVILNSCSDTVHVWVCAFVSIYVHTCRLSHFSCLNKISLIHILCCFLWVFFVIVFVILKPENRLSVKSSPDDLARMKQMISQGMKSPSFILCQHRPPSLSSVCVWSSHFLRLSFEV